MKIKPLLLTLLFLLCGGNQSHSVEEPKITDFLSVVKDSVIRNQIKDSVTRDAGIFISIKNDFVFLSAPKDGESSYISNTTGDFHGKFSPQYVSLIEKYLKQMLRDIKFDDHELKILRSITDGMSVTISDKKDHFTLSDPVILYLYEDDKYSEKLSGIISSTLRILFDSAKFDVTIYKYLSNSVDDFDLSVKTYDDFLGKLNIQRAELRKENQNLNDKL